MDNNANPVGNLADQGSSSFDSALDAASATPPATQAPTTSSPTTPQGENGQTQVSPAAQQPAAQPTKQTPPTEPAANGKPAPSHAEIIQATADAVLRARDAQAPKAPPAPKSVAEKPVGELTPQEFAERFGVTRANDALIQQIQGADPKAAAAALDTYGQNLVRQAVLMTMEVAEAKIKALEQSVRPHTDSWQAHQKQVREQQLETDFFKSHPDLQNERDLVMEMKDAMIARVNSGQVKFNNAQEAFDAVAAAARKILSRTAPGLTNGNPGPAAVAQQASPPPSRQMSAASSAGRAGSGQANPKSVVDDIFGSDAR